MRLGRASAAVSHMADIHQLETELASIEQTLGKLYRRRDEILPQLAEARGEYELPKPRYQTDKQRAVSRCPRCGGKIEP